MARQVPQLTRVPPSCKKRVSVGDLFCGAGLFGQAFKQEGARLRFAVEMDRHAASSYAQNVGNHVEIGKVELLAPPSNADILIAGPPCQGFSTLGRRDPRDVRNQLCLDVPRWARAARSSVVVIENVPPFLESPQWIELSEQLGDMGFEVATWVLDAADFGVPQHRRRSFTIASKIGLPSSPEVRARRMANDAFRKTSKYDPMHVWPEPTTLAKSRIQLIPPGGDRRDLVRLLPNECPPSWTRIGCQATDVWGRMNVKRPANTLRCDFQNPSKGRYIHPTLNRMISLREGARLQQIPEDWTLNGHRTAITRQIGNGVPLGLGTAIAKRVLELF